MKAGELTRHVQHCENEVDNLPADNIEERRTMIRDEISRITLELSELAKFSRLNYTGFVKILKKHDKRTDFMLRPMFMLRLKTKPLYVENSDSLIYRLSKLYDQIRSDPRPRPEGEASQSHGQVFVRTTSKYWVHYDNVTEAKCFILKYLPVLVFPSRRRKLDLAVSSVYLDNDQMDLYRGRLEKKEGAIAIRIRWYGSDEPQELFVERKMHKEDWTGEVSVKARFPIKAKHVNEFLKGTYQSEDLRKKFLKDSTINSHEIDDLVALASDIQNSILTMGLRPKLRTFYNRTAFQFPGDARVRISLDTDLCMIREDGPKRSGEGWKREDLEIVDYPFSGLPPGEITRFPHAILEVKLQTQAGQEPPNWANALISSHLVEEVPKFSKYIHGCATLFPETLSLFPYWLPQMETDIRRPQTTELEVDSDDVNLGGSSEEVSSSGKEPATLTGANHLVPPPTKQADHLSIVITGDDGETEKTLLLQKEKTPDRLPLMFKGALSSIIDSHKDSKEETTQQKRIHVPVRVEPKVFFANERTFLSWIHFAIFLGGIAIALVGLGNKHARLSGYLFGLVSALFTIYALYLYLWRAERIREREPGPYDDRFGPVLVVLVFLAAMVVNMIFGALQE